MAFSFDITEHTLSYIRPPTQLVISVTLMKYTKDLSVRFDSKDTHIYLLIYILINMYLYIDGQIYFIKGWHLRLFGFPRISTIEKMYKWKKMNYTTDLPKHDPIASYLVATG